MIQLDQGDHTLPLKSRVDPLVCYLTMDPRRTRSFHHTSNVANVEGSYKKQRLSSEQPDGSSEMVSSWTSFMGADDAIGAAAPTSSTTAANCVSEGFMSTAGGSRACGRTASSAASGGSFPSHAKTRAAALVGATGGGRCARWPWCRASLTTKTPQFV